MRQTGDVDVQHRLRIGDRHQVVWGGGWRVTGDRIDGSFAVGFEPRRRTRQLVSAFVQDEVAIVPRRLAVIGGTKLEVQSMTGLECNLT